MDKDFLGRMRVELNDLVVKRSKLQSFLNDDFKCSSIGAPERSLLVAQFNAMTEYSDILTARIYLAEKKWGVENAETSDNTKN